jgi:hypothetical protein
MGPVHVAMGDRRGMIAKALGDLNRHHRSAMPVRAQPLVLCDRTAAVLYSPVPFQPSKVFDGFSTEGAHILF